MPFSDPPALEEVVKYLEIHAPTVIWLHTRTQNYKKRQVRLLFSSVMVQGPAKVGRGDP